MPSSHRARLDVRKFSFVHRSVKIWNSLPEEVVSAKSVDTFKGRLDRYWKHQDLYYDHTAELLLYPSPRDIAEVDEEGVL